MKTALGLLVAVAVGIALFESTMQPSSSEVLQLLLIFAGLAIAVGAAAWLVPRWARRATSLERTIVVVSVASALIVAVAVTVAALLMFLSGHDLNLLLVVLVFAGSAGIVFAVSVSRPLVADLRKMRLAADQVSAGDLDVSTGIERPDELGDAAAAMDEMVLRLAAVEAERTQAERTRRELLAAIGHDLRTPLSALQAAVEAMADGVSPDPERYLRSMQRDLRAMGSLVDDLFLLARIESGDLDFDRVPLDLAELADEAIDALDPMARAHAVTLRLETAGAVRTVGGPTALGRVIRNLVDNAIHHAPAESDVVVSVANGSGALLRVVDAGPGFDPDFVEDAFGSFVRADPARARNTGGAGLGLAIARGIVHAHGGDIWAEAGPGGRVAFRLPRQPATV